MDNSGGSIELPGFPVVVEFPIQWGDLDAYGHVNNLVYLRWFEAARAVYASQVGVAVVPSQSGVGAVLSAISCKYMRQLNYPGDVLAGVRVARMSLGSVTLEFQIVDDKLLCLLPKGVATLCCTTTLPTNLCRFQIMFVQRSKRWKERRLACSIPFIDERTWSRVLLEWSSTSARNVIRQIDHRFQRTP